MAGLRAPGERAMVGLVLSRLSLWLSLSHPTLKPLFGFFPSGSLVPLQEISELDKARILRKGLQLPEKKRPSAQAIEMKKQATKINAAAGLLRMALWMGEK